MSGENGRKKMETQFYEDMHNPWTSKKKCMTLDLDTGKRKHSVLSTPDVQMLKLASPELEKMIISQQGNICTTPTPTQFICPKNVTDEQAAFAQGFVEALQSLHQRNDTTLSGDESVLSDDDGSSDTGDQSDLCPSTTYHQALLTQTTISSMTTAPTSIYNPAMPTTTSLPGSTVSFGTRDSMQGGIDSTGLTTGRWPRVDIKQEPLHEEPQTVPVFHPGNPPMSPINMEMQESIKAERKRLRNRIAASKCRKRKLERISRLEDKVKDLKTMNSDLSATATKLRDQVCALKQSVMEHVKSGCQVMLAQQLAF